MVAVLDCMREVEHRIAHRAPFDEVIAKIDECLSLLGSDAYRPSIEHYRVGAYSSDEWSDRDGAVMLKTMKSMD